MTSSPSEDGRVQLTPREREIVVRVRDGKSYKAIALELPNLRSFRGGTIRPRTVQMHVSRIADKIGGDGPPYYRVMRWALKHAA